MPIAYSRAVFLDRDGTLNIDPGYLNDPSQLKLFPQTALALHKLSAHGFKIFVVSNQSGVARGLISFDDLNRVNQRLEELISPVKVDAFLLCTHHPDENCQCRKPLPKLAMDAASQFQIDLSSSYMIGDRDSDYHFGENAKFKASLLVRTGHGKETEDTFEKNKIKALFFDDLMCAVDWILNQENVKP